MFRMSHKHCTVSGRVPKISWTTVFGKGGWIKTLDAWAANKQNKGGSSTQFLLREFYKECTKKKVLWSLLGMESFPKI